MKTFYSVFVAINEITDQKDEELKLNSKELYFLDQNIIHSDFQLRI